MRRRARTRAEAIAKLLGFAAVAGATIFVIWQLRPDLLFSPNMDVGGDNAGHVVTPYFLIHDLLPQGRITGWDPQWFEGFPLYVFYFPLPALLVAAFSVAFPYAVAFKLVTVLGVVTLPVAAWAFGRLADFKRPVPVLMALATLPFLVQHLLRHRRWEPHLDSRRRISPSLSPSRAGCSSSACSRTRSERAAFGGWPQPFSG